VPQDASEQASSGSELPSSDRSGDPAASRFAERLLTGVLFPLELIGRSLLNGLVATGGVTLLVVDAAGKIPKSFLGKRGKRLAWENLTYQMVRVGVKAAPIVCLVVFCIGAILSLQIVPILADYGAADQVARIIAIAMFRELGPLVGAITLTGYAGASIAAEIGTMTVSEEIEAMETAAINPVSFLVVPRLIATALMTVCLAVLANVVGVGGGLVVGVLAQDMSPESYLRLTIDAIAMRDFASGLIKAFVFGTIIAGLACWLGLNVKGGAQGVGDATTRTVVLTIVALTLVDLLFTWLFFVVGV
jgi:phospholipid/cholesterol/gamma-HCH transport system permease protein